MRNPVRGATAAGLILLASVSGCAHAASDGMRSIARNASVGPRPNGKAPREAVCPVFLQLDMQASLSPAQIDIVRQELTLIWLPYAVVLVWSSPSAGGDSDGVNLRVVVDDERVTGAAETGISKRLGAAIFVESGLPQDVLYVSPSVTRRLVREAHYRGRSVATLPRALQNQLLALALARVIAHELGHILLSSTKHAERGLMRPVFSGDDLVRAAGLFQLEETERDRLTQLGHCRSVSPTK